MKLQHLQSLSVSHDCSYQTDTTADESLCNLLTATDIQKLRVEVRDPDPVVMHPYGPLFYKKLHNLNSLTLESYVQTAGGLSDIHFQDLVRSCPNLQKLNLTLPDISLPQLMNMTSWSRMERIDIHFTGENRLTTQAFLQFVTAILCQPVTSISVNNVSLLFRKSDQRKLLRLISQINSFLRLYIRVQDEIAGSSYLRYHSDVDRMFTSIRISPST